jgi:hypothetical protein
MRALVGILLVVSACGGRRAPVESAAPVESVAPVPIATVTAAAHEEPAEAAGEEAPAEVAAPPTAPPTAAPLDEAPVIDCSTVPGGKAPSPQWLCEIAMAKRATDLLDGNGFALVTQFSMPGEDVDPEEGNKKERVCGAEAEDRVQRLLVTARYKLAAGDDPAPAVTCKGMRCDLRGDGEWSTTITLWFRKGKQGPVLEAWTEIEIVLVPPDVVAERQKFLDKWRRTLAKKKCAR